MPTTLRRRVRHVRRVLVYGAAGLVILAGLLVAVASQLLPLVEQRPRQLAAWLSERSGQPVAFAASQAEWTRRGPLFVLDGLTVGRGDAALDVGRAELLVDVYAGLLPGRPLTELQLRGVELEVSRDAAGRWRVAGIGASSSGGNQRLRQLEGLGEVQLENARVRVTDAVTGQAFALDRVDARVLASGGRVRVGATARRGAGAPLSLAADLDPTLSDGRAWLGGRDLALADWLGDLAWRQVALHGGSGDLQLWVELDDRRMVSAQLEADLSGMGLRGLQPIVDGKATVEPRVGLDRLAVSARWRALANGWELSVPTLQLDDGGSHGGGAGLWLSRRGGSDTRVWQAQAASLEIATPLALSVLTDLLPPASRRWLYLAAPHGTASDLRLLCGSAGCSAQAGLEQVEWSRVGRVPGLEGLAGRLDVGGDAALFVPGQSPLLLDARPTFRGPLRFTLAGRLHALREPGGWRVGTDALRIRGADFAATAAGDLLFEPGGRRPRVDLFADIADTSVAAASQFWVSRMPPRAVQWLDQALVSGRVTGGRLVLQGDLDDWPFRDNTGVFDAEAALEDVVLDYRPGEWPRGEGISGSVRFRNAGMEASARGSIAGVAVERVDGSIADFKEPVLELEIAGGGSGEALLELLRASPLGQRYGSHLLGVSVGGRAEVGVDLLLPLKRELGEPRVLGTADLADADLADAKWGLAFDGATGRVRFGSAGFAAEELRVRFGGRPATLSLAVGDYASDPALAAEASLRGRLEADALLAHAPTLEWMAPYVDGVSDWQLLLLVPREGSDGQRELRLASDLEGTSLAFPAPLRKSAAARLPLQLQARLPLEQGGVELALGELLTLRGVLPANGGFNGVAAFGAVEVPEPPAHGLRVVGAVPALEAAGWLAVAASRGGGGAAAGSGDVLVDSVDVRAGQLDLAGRRFSDTRLQVRDQDGDTRIELEGPAVAGALVLPGRDAAQRGITARFERLHLPGADDVAAGNGAAGTLLETLDPRDVPSLHAWVGDLHLGAAALGEARLETFPTPEGMHVQLFEARSNALELRASGDWTRREERERSTFQIGFTAEQLGAMLEALGFARMVEGGQTLARLDVTWPGAPSEFQLERLDGRLAISVGQGSVPDVKPGAGRILGLLSLSEIPRRLALDFSDFFTEGFSFNTIQGDFVLDSGSAWTENLVIDAAAAEIRVRGRTGMADRTYDQTMEVLPRTSGVLPVVGAIAGGPAGAAIGAVAQAVLQRPMNEMARAVYRVQGSWDDPEIELVERGPARP
jgi:uncharacterized protein (TIGR02099 family)